MLVALAFALGRPQGDCSGRAATIRAMLHDARCHPPAISCPTP